MVECDTTLVNDNISNLIPYTIIAFFDIKVYKGRIGKQKYDTYLITVVQALNLADNTLT